MRKNKNIDILIAVPLWVLLLIGEWWNYYLCGDLIRKLKMGECIENVTGMGDRSDYSRKIYNVFSWELFMIMRNPRRETIWFRSILGH